MASDAKGILELAAIQVMQAAHRRGLAEGYAPVNLHISCPWVRLLVHSFYRCR